MKKRRYIFKDNKKCTIGFKRKHKNCMEQIIKSKYLSIQIAQISIQEHVFHLNYTKII